MTSAFEPLKPVGDVVSITLVFGIFLEVLPHMVAFFSLVWIILRCYESYLNIKQKRRELE